MSQACYKNVTRVYKAIYEALEIMDPGAVKVLQNGVKNNDVNVINNGCDVIK